MFRRIFSIVQLQSAAVQPLISMAKVKLQCLVVFHNLVSSLILGSSQHVPGLSNPFLVLPNP